MMHWKACVAIVAPGNLSPTGLWRFYGFATLKPRIRGRAQSYDLGPCPGPKSPDCRPASKV